MSSLNPKFVHPPIIEAVVDIDCDMPPGQDFAALEQTVRDVFRPEYPKFRKAFVQTHQFEQKPDQPPKMSGQHSIQAYQFLHDDEKQLAQVRAQGFSFNRLAPYTSLDDYLPKIQQAWKLFISVASPVQIRAVRLRYINRIMLPLAANGAVNLDDYLKIGPQLPDEQRFTLTGFLNQQSAVEFATGNQINIILTGQPIENGKAPVILDITVAGAAKAEPQNFAWLLGEIQSLRALKNHIFTSTLTEPCQKLFQQP
jgi:uncharacterized protein (TIGR04255 family)